MADNVGIVTGSGAQVSTDQINVPDGAHHQNVSIEFGTKDQAGGPTRVDAVANPLPTVDEKVLLQLLRALAALARPEHYDPTQNALRVSLGTPGQTNALAALGSVATVTSVTNSVGMGSASFDAKTSMLWATERELWATAIRGRVT